MLSLLVLDVLLVHTVRAMQNAKSVKDAPLHRL